ncbi:MAG: hypothetical protein ACW99G_05130 [Candidatus Thorarchaeota archaeon]|jgi:hypothetical protein
MKDTTKLVAAWWFFLVIVGSLLASFDVAGDNAGLVIIGTLIAIFGSIAFNLTEEV